MRRGEVRGEGEVMRGEKESRSEETISERKRGENKERRRREVRRCLHTLFYHHIIKTFL